MVFSSYIFIFAFLPVVFCGYYLLSAKAASHTAAKAFLVASCLQDLAAKLHLSRRNHIQPGAHRILQAPGFPDRRGECSRRNQPAVMICRDPAAWLEHLRLNRWTAAATLLLLLLSISSMNKISPFIYFNF